MKLITIEKNISKHEKSDILKIRLKLYAYLRKYLPNTQLGEEIIMEVSKGTTVKDILDNFNIEKDQAKIIFVNRTHQTLDYELQNNDLLVIFPPVGGG